MLIPLKGRAKFIPTQRVESTCSEVPLVYFPRRGISRAPALRYAKRGCPVCVLDVLDMTGGAARYRRFCSICGCFEDLRVVALRAGCARISSINVGAHITSLVTTAARHHLVRRVRVMNTRNARNGTNTFDVESVKLRVSPLLRVVSIGPVLF